VEKALADLTGMPGSLEQLGRQIRAKVLPLTGIPTGVGIATTKTLAKLANHAAKRWQRQTGGVVDIRSFPRSAWECRRRRSASAKSGRRTSTAGFPRRSVGTIGTNSRANKNRWVTAFGLTRPTKLS